MVETGALAPDLEGVEVGGEGDMDVARAEQGEEAAGERMRKKAMRAGKEKACGRS